MPGVLEAHSQRPEHSASLANSRKDTQRVEHASTSTKTLPLSSKYAEQSLAQVSEVSGKIRHAFAERVIC